MAMESVTITLLPVSLSLIHIPRFRFVQLSHPIIRLLLSQSPTFLNITCNELEISLFIHHHALKDFEPIARRDRLRAPSRSKLASSTGSGSTVFESVETSYEKWNVLQIDSHSEQLDNSGTRVRELSAPLADAGISILYQSSYMSDFILVKQVRLREVTSLLASAGFDVYSPDSSPLLPPPSPLPLPPAMLPPIVGETDILHTHPPSDSTHFPGTEGSQEQQQPPTTATTPLPLGRQRSPGRKPADHLRSKSHSPTAGDVRVLSPDLTCVGLSNDSFDHWVTKIIKLVAFPDLIIPPSYASSPAAGVSLHRAAHGSPSPLEEHQTPPSPWMNRLGEERTENVSYDSGSSSSDEDGYFSHSPDGFNSAASSPFTTNTTIHSQSYPDLTKGTMPMSPSKHLIPSSPYLRAVSGSRSDRSVRHHTTVPFFSFTRTSEGSSLCTDVRLLAALFPAHERHMVICSGELDAIDASILLHSVGSASTSDDDDKSESDAYGQGGGTLKCLQIDLRRFGLDKHGLVNRFSRVLEKNGINHMYSSTFKTANLLVDKRHAARARSLLSAC